VIFENVVGILDENKRGLLEQLGTTFPEFNFFSIPANDVRSKPAVPARDAVVGLVDENGIVRSEYEQPLNDLFDTINARLQCHEPKKVAAAQVQAP
jgi:hypothetical protein